MDEKIDKLTPEEPVGFNKRSLQNTIFLIETKINEIIDAVNLLLEESDDDMDEDDIEEEETPIKLSDIHLKKPKKK